MVNVLTVSASLGDAALSPHEPPLLVSLSLPSFWPLFLMHAPLPIKNNHGGLTLYAMKYIIWISYNTYNIMDCIPHFIPHTV